MAGASAQQGSADLPTCRLLIGGQWVTGEKAVPVMDKFRLVPFMQAQLPSRQQLSACVASADAAFQASKLTPHERGAILDRAAALIEKRASELADVLGTEAGFPRRDAMGEVQRTANTFRLSAEDICRLVANARLPDHIHLAG